MKLVGVGGGGEVYEDPEHRILVMGENENASAIRVGLVELRELQCCGIKSNCRSGEV